MAIDVDSDLQLVTEKRKEFYDLYERYDDDRKLAVLDPYEMRNPDGQPTPDVINVTMNEAKVFLDRSAAIMNGANMHRIVTGRNLKDDDTTTIENFYEDIYYTNDQMVARIFFTSLYGFLIEQILVRGAIAARCLMREDGDKFLPDITPLDVRYFVYENDSQGMVWGAPSTVMSKVQIEREFGIVTHGSKSSVVTDFWDDEVNKIFIAKKLYTGGSQTLDEEKFPQREIAHGLGYPPLIYFQSGAGLQSTMDSGGLEHQGESIFAPNRGLIPELHRAASIFQTLTSMAFEQSLTWESDKGTAAKKTPSPFGRRKVIPADKGGGFRAIPIADVRNATRLLFNMLTGALQRGGLPNIDYGNLSFPLSAVAISKLTSSKDAIFTPRLNAISMFYRALSQMIKKQYIQGGFTVELGEEGDEREYKVSDIDKRFSTKYEFHSQSPEQDIANMTIAQTQKALGISTHTIFTNTIRFNDPEGEINKSRDEAAEKGDIAITLMARLKSLADKDGNFDEETSVDIKAEFILQQLEMVLRARAMGNPMGMEPQRGGFGADQSIKPVVPLLDGGVGRSQPEGDEETMSAEESEQRSERRETAVARNRGEG